MKPVCFMLLPALAFASGAANAESWPTRALHVIVPFGTGSTTDIVPRAVFENSHHNSGRASSSRIVSGLAGPSVRNSSLEPIPMVTPFWSTQTLTPSHLLFIPT